MCGAAGGIGQPLSLLLKQSPLVTDLRLYDIVHTPGVAADLSHIDTPSKVTGLNGPENVEKILEGTCVKMPLPHMESGPTIDRPCTYYYLVVVIFRRPYRC